jgi:MFS family permease
MSVLTKPGRETTPVTQRRGISLETFAAFRSRPFRLLWLNSFSFVLSGSIRQFAFVWLALELSDSARALGVISFALGIPVLLFSLPAGALADRVDRRRLMVYSQLGALAVTVLTAALIFAGVVEVWSAFLLAVALGGSVAFGQPVRQAVVPSLVEPDRLLNAVTLMSLGQNTTMIIGPAISGVVIALGGVGAAFVLQAVLLVLGLVVLLPLRVPMPKGTGQQRRIGAELKEGFVFVAGHPGIRTLLLVLLVTAVVMAGTFQTLLPKIAREELGSGAFGASMLFGAMGVGMLMSSLILASMKSLHRAGLAFLTTLIIGGVLNTSTGLSPWYTLTFLLMFATGWNAGFFTNLNLTLIQAHTPDRVMGRVMSLYMLCMLGGMPLGALIAGIAAEAIGAPEWYAVCGVGLFIVGWLALLTQPSLRRMSATPSAPRGKATAATAPVSQADQRSR